jgi:hypothetical protein
MLPTTRLHYMRGEYYLPWQRALGGERKEKAFGDMYAISAFGNEFALYRQDFMLHGGQTKGETYPRPGDQASAEVTKDVAPKSWWHYDATKQTGKDKLESIADIIKWKLLELGLISSKYSPLDPCHITAIDDISRLHCSCFAADASGAPAQWQFSLSNRN